MVCIPHRRLIGGHVNKSFANKTWWGIYLFIFLVDENKWVYAFIIYLRNIKFRTKNKKENKGYIIPIFSFFFLF